MVNAFLVGDAEIARACPHCRAGTAAVGGATSSASDARRAKYANSARSMGGTLVIWIGQTDNPGQVRNTQLVRDSERAGLIVEQGYREALSGVCNAIVTEFFRILLTGGSLVPFYQDMLSINDFYRELQADYIRTMQAYRLAANLVRKNALLIQKYTALIDAGGATPRAIREHWEAERERCLKSIDDNADKVHRWVKLLYTTPNLVSSGITDTRIQGNEALDATIALRASSSAGCYLFALQGRTTGHAVGIHRTRNLFSDDLFLFIDPNTGVFAFRDATAFSAFIQLYWRTVLASEFTDGTICKYALKKK
ncbi:MAG: hypothetical protein EOO71_41435 [Myxococcaceae bacterium]|nr:MAG: hypothetical protein EOO71_41435 [Myxococcaceae bacterium]